jgi:hypothetical protein
MEIDKQNYAMILYIYKQSLHKENTNMKTYKGNESSCLLVIHSD